MQILLVFPVIPVDNSQEDTDEYVHTNHQEDHEKQDGPRIVIVCRHSESKHVEGDIE